MSEQEEMKMFETITAGLKISYENLLRKKAALGQDMVFGDEHGLPRIVPADEALEDYLRQKRGSLRGQAN